MSTSSEHPLLRPQVGSAEPATPLTAAERETLFQRIRELEAERDAYQGAAYAWALSQVTDDDIRRYAVDEPSLPLADFLRELEAAARKPQSS